MVKAIHELPYEIALEIMIEQGYDVEKAEEILAIARGESKGDRVRVSTPSAAKALAEARLRKTKS